MDHNWTAEDDIVAFYLYKHGDEGLLFSRKKICDKLEIQIGAMRMREGNFKSLATDGKEGLDHPAKQSCKIYELYKSTPEGEFKSVVDKILKK